MDSSIDFRSMYASILDGWMGGGSSSVLGAAFTDLGLFKPAAPPLPPPDPIVAVNRLAGDFVGIAPARLYDSREAPRYSPLGEGEWVHVPVIGVGGVPGDGVTAVALNVSCVDGTVPGSFTVWPTGGRQPSTANVTVPVGTASSTVVVVEPGPSGQVSVLNRSGSANLIVDVVGFFRTAPAFKFAPVTPARLLDSRIKRRPLVTNQTINLRVRGLAGVPLNADSVVLNVTAVTPTSPGFLTVFPTGSPRQLTSSLNFAAGAIVPNLVIAKVGAGHSISLYNFAGATHVVVDVVGYFSGTARGHYTPIEPTTALAAQFGPGATIAVPVCGVGAVPGGGVSAAIVNISVRNPSDSSFLTAWPSATRRPTAANLNPTAGQNCSNLAFVKLGADGQVWLYNNSGVSDVVVDVLGWFSA
jgi:hypothetical protein